MKPNYKKQFSDDLEIVRNTKILDEARWKAIIDDLKQNKIFDYYCLYVYVMCDFCLQRKRFDEVSVLLKDLEEVGNANNDLAKAYFSLLTGIYHWYKSFDAEMVEKYANEAIIIHTKFGQKDQIILFAAHQHLGVALFMHCKYFKAYEHFQFAMKIPLPDFFKYRKAMTYSWLGRLEEHFHNTKTAIWNYLKCAEILKKYSLHTAHADILNTIGVMHFEMKRYEEAFELYTESLEISVKHKIDITATDTYVNLGLYHNEKKDFEKATEYYFKALEMRDAEHISQKYISNTFLIGKNYLDTDDLDLAYQWLLEALEKALQLKNDVFLTSQIYGYLGVFYQKKKDYKNALENFKLAQNIIPENHVTRHSLWLCTLFAEYYEEQKQYKKAMEVLKQYKKILAEIEDEEMNQSFEFIQFKAKIDFA